MENAESQSFQKTANNLKSVKDSILNKLKIVDQIVLGVHSTEEKEKVRMTTGIYDQPLTNDIATSNFELYDFEAKIRGDKVDNRNGEIFLDGVIIGGVEVQTSCQRAANTVISAQNEISYISVKLMSQIRNTSGSIESLQDRSAYVEPPELPISERALLNDKDQLIKVESSMNLSIGHSMDSSEINYPEVFQMINEAYARLRSAILYNTLTNIPADPEELFTVEMIITNRKVIKEVVERYLNLRFLNSDDSEKSDYLNNIMDSISDEFQVSPLTEKKLTLGINMAKIDKSTKPNWTVNKEGRNFRKSNGVSMRIIQLKDTCADVPITSEMLVKVIPVVEQLERSFMMWSEDSTRKSLGLEPLFTDYLIPKVEKHDEKISEILGISEGDSIRMRRELMDKIKLYIKETVQTMRDDNNTDSLKGFKR